MIKVNLSEALCYDMLSIIEVKYKEKKSDKEEIFSEFLRFEKEILNGVGKIHHKIMVSDEYQNLFLTNKKLFDLVDLAKKDEVKASEVDHYVWLRYLAKKALQDKFFPQEKLTEIKLGYKNE